MRELSSEAKTLIQRAREADGPGPDRRARVKRRVLSTLFGSGVSLGAATATAGPALLGTKSALSTGVIFAWLGAGLALGTVVSAPALVMKLERGGPPAAVASARDREQAPPSQRPSEPEGVAPREAPAPAVTPPPAAPPAERHAWVAPAAPPSLVESAPSLADETRLLEAAQRELASGRAASALSLLDKHRQRFPNAALAEERSAARVLTLCALGRTEEARRAAWAFLAVAPTSPLVPRLRGSCALDGAADDAIPTR